MEIIQNLHSYFAYIVLAILVLATINAIMGWLGKKEFRFDKDYCANYYRLV